ncbi:MAG: hypothetical protein LUC20_05255 [Oscillospiraceae bacterium]|nr:hypothetical protein [Oscillospiraceae bacterium]
MNERELDLLIESTVSDEPPEDIVRDVTPWRRATTRILVGLALSTITLQFLLLQYILPTVGAILLVLGFRALRRENLWFRAAWYISAIGAVYQIAMLAACATRYSQSVSALVEQTALQPIILALGFARLVCLRQGLAAVQKKSGMEPHVGAGTALLVLYAVMLPLGLVNYSGWLVVLALLALYVFIIRLLFKLSAELDEAGYCVQPSPVRLSDTGVVCVLLGALLLGLTAAQIFASSYPMHWQKTESTAEAETEEIKAQLTALGFPEDILDDLTDSDILECSGALYVDVQQSVVYANDGLDGNDICATAVIVLLNAEPETWKVFHHFRWEERPGFRGTESVQVRPTSIYDIDWELGESFGGQALCDMDGDVYTSPFYSLGENTYSYTNFFGKQSEYTDITADFSLPNKAENQRVYVSYTVKEKIPPTGEATEETYITSNLFYTHQLRRLQYPVYTAHEERQTGLWLRSNGAFTTIEAINQFIVPSQTD